MNNPIQRIPLVFVSPNKIDFYIDTISTHSRYIKIYNPYDVTIKYKVLILHDSADKYDISNAEGVIKSQALVELLIRHLMPTSANCNITDVIRIVLLDNETKQIIGKRDIEVKLLPGKEKASSDNKVVAAQNSCESSDVDTRHQQHANISLRDQNSTISPRTIVIMIGILVCVLLLILPSPDDESMIPNYMRVNSSMKYCITFFLGGLCVLFYEKL